jgi:hypothetical protein
MKSSILAAPPRRQLTLVTPGTGDFGIGPEFPGGAGRPGFRAVTRIWLEPEEWALALLPPGTSARAARPLVRRLVSGGRPCEGGWGGRCAVVRVPAEALGGQLGPALFHHTRDQVTVYCPADQITEEAARALALIASRAAGILGPAEAGYEIGLVRVAHRELPDGRHPAQVETCGSTVTAYVCAATVTEDLADALGLLSTACASHLSSAASSGLRWDTWPRLH